MGAVATVNVEEVHEGTDALRLGADLLELVSSAMHVAPLSVFREYVQNAADSIDDARGAGVFSPDEKGRVEIHLDQVSRSVRIRDNGMGIAAGEFFHRLTALGASPKRGSKKRGMRGVGRLIGLGFCQELVFRSQAGQAHLELRWDCRKLREAVGAGGPQLTIDKAIRSITTLKRTSSQSTTRFFEVELVKVVRQPGDLLLDEAAVRSYVAQVAPLPFHADFQFRDRIETFLEGDLSAIEVVVNGGEPMTRPHATPESGGPNSVSGELELVSVPAMDGTTAAKGWILHGAYAGARPRDAGIRGIRLRHGNMQIGDEGVVDQLFQEPRFNVWSVGEIHVLDPKLMPNGRRDNFDQSVHLGNLHNHLTPVLRNISSLCRRQSQRRQAFRLAMLMQDRVETTLDILKQGALSVRARDVQISEARKALARLDRPCRAPYLSEEERQQLVERKTMLEERVSRAAGRLHTNPALTRVSSVRRHSYEEVFEQIYAVSRDARQAHALVDELVRRLARKP